MEGEEEELEVRSLPILEVSECLAPKEDEGWSEQMRPAEWQTVPVVQTVPVARKRESGPGWKQSLELEGERQGAERALASAGD